MVKEQISTDDIPIYYNALPVNLQSALAGCVSMSSTSKIKNIINAYPNQLYRFPSINKFRKVTNKIIRDGPTMSSSKLKVLFTDGMINAMIYIFIISFGIDTVRDNLPNRISLAI